MWNLLACLNRNLTLAIPVMMVIGFGAGVIFDMGSLRIMVLPLSFIMIYPMMVKLNGRSLLDFSDARAQILAQAINLLVIPFLAFGVGLFFFAGHPNMILGLLVIGLLPTSSMTIAWTGISGGNIAAAVKMTILGLSLGALAAPLYVELLLGASLDISLLEVSKRILTIVLVPMAAGYVTRLILSRAGESDPAQSHFARRLELLIAPGVLGIVFIALGINSRPIMAQPALLPYLLIPLSLVYLLYFGLGTLAGRLLLSRPDAVALVYGTALRNLAIALALTMGAFGAEGYRAALVVTLAYVVQPTAATLFSRMYTRLLG